MNKKGFTIMELLSVIVIITVIALIIVPAVLGRIKEANEDTIKTSAKNYIEALDKFMTDQELSNKDDSINFEESTTYNIDGKNILKIDGTSLCTNNLCEDLDIDGQLPEKKDSTYSNFILDVEGNISAATLYYGSIEVNYKLNTGNTQDNYTIKK